MNRTSRPRLICLLPVRNAGEYLTEYFESAGRFADAVVALDDGSEDDSHALLSAHPLVEVLLSRPSRTGHREWNDGSNRNALLRAAAELNPDWIISIDADERLDASDSAALRDFLATPPDPTLAYSLEVFRMLGTGAVYDKRNLFVQRLFRFRRGVRFPEDRLHADPVPTDIPTERRVRTTLRIQHFAGTNESKRRLRYEKYLEADPRREFQPSYERLLDPPGNVRPWKARNPDWPLLAAPATNGLDSTRSGAEPAG